MRCKLLKIDESAYRKVIQQAQSAWPLECCGALVGTSSEGVPHVWEALPATAAETLAGPREFRISAGELVGFQAQASRSRHEILGFFHSHPDAPPTPSQADLEGAMWTDCFTLIIAVDAHGSVQTRVYLLTGNALATRAFLPARLEIVTLREQTS